MKPHPVSEGEAPKPRSAQAMIVFFDAVDEAGLPYLDVEFHAADPNNVDSMSNVMLKWMGQDWGNTLARFGAELKAFIRDRAPVIASSEPKIIGIDGSVLSSDSYPSAPLQ